VRWFSIFHVEIGLRSRFCIHLQTVLIGVICVVKCI
jgi:hypothetical protein